MGIGFPEPCPSYRAAIKQVAPASRLCRRRLKPVAAKIALRPQRIIRPGDRCNHHIRNRPLEGRGRPGSRGDSPTKPKAGVTLRGSYPDFFPFMARFWFWQVTSHRHPFRNPKLLHLADLTSHIGGDCNGRNYRIPHLNCRNPHLSFLPAKSRTSGNLFFTGWNALICLS
jgi:hypothetical protein